MYLQSSSIVIQSCSQHSVVRTGNVEDQPACLLCVSPTHPSVYNKVCVCHVYTPPKYKCTVHTELQQCVPLYVLAAVCVYAAPDSGTGYYEAVPQVSIVTHSKRDISVQLKHDIGVMGTDVEEQHAMERVGVWRRRRRLDGALNRVPKEFCSQVWYILEKVG